MLTFLARRLLSTIPVLLIVAVLVFLMLRLTPGDPAAVLAGDAATTEQIAQIRANLGLDRSRFPSSSSSGSATCSPATWARATTTRPRSPR